MLALFTSPPMKRTAKLVVLGDSVALKRDLLISLCNPNYPEEYSISHEFGM